MSHRFILSDRHESQVARKFVNLEDGTGQFVLGLACLVKGFWFLTKGLILVFLHVVWGQQMLAKVTSAMHKPAQQTVIPASYVPTLLASLPLKKM